MRTIRIHLFFISIAYWSTLILRRFTIILCMSFHSYTELIARL